MLLTVERSHYMIYRDGHSEFFQIIYTCKDLNALLKTFTKQQTTYNNVLGFILLFSISLLCKKDSQGLSEQFKPHTINNIIRDIPVAKKDNPSLCFDYSICELFIFNLSYCTTLKIDAGAV